MNVMFILCTHYCDIYFNNITFIYLFYILSSQINPNDPIYYNRTVNISMSQEEKIKYITYKFNTGCIPIVVSWVIFERWNVGGEVEKTRGWFYFLLLLRNGRNLSQNFCRIDIGRWNNRARKSPADVCGIHD